MALDRSSVLAAAITIPLLPERHILDATRQFSIVADAAGAEFKPFSNEVLKTITQLGSAVSILNDAVDEDDAVCRNIFKICDNQFEIMTKSKSPENLLRKY